MDPSSHGASTLGLLLATISRRTPLKVYHSSGIREQRDVDGEEKEQDK